MFIGGGGAVEHWSIENSHTEMMIIVIEMRILKWICEHDKRDKTKNKDILDKMRETFVLQAKRKIY